MGFLNTTLNTILDIIFPIYCISCHKSGQNLCLDCLSQIPTAERESDDWIFPLFDYRHPPIKQAVWLLKYKGKHVLAKNFATLLYGHMSEELADLKIMRNFIDPILIPIPIEKSRRRERGFNQAELICQELVKIDLSAQAGTNQNYILNKDILIKVKDTGHQARIGSRATRLKNIINSFDINPKINTETIKGRNIILIDDVTTTGATLREAKKILKQAGARKVVAFTVAH